MPAPFARKTLTRDALVVGAGVSGLSCAIRLAETGFSVRVLARERTPHTTSDLAAAVWYPFLCGPPDRALAWSRTTFRVLKELAREPAAGIAMVEGGELSGGDPAAPPWWADAVDRFRAAHPGEIVPGRAGGFLFDAPVAAMPAYMAWLEARAAALGIAIETRTVRDLQALLLEASVVVDCAGLGAGELVRDPALHPVRGQVVRVAPGRVRRFLQAGGPGEPPTYVIPRPDCTVLGGTEEAGSWDLAVDPATSEDILARCVGLVPDLAGAAVLSHAVGLRPARAEVRLETDRLPGGIVIHDYGHGGAGFTLSWGCADEVARRAAAAVPPR